MWWNLPVPLILLYEYKYTLFTDNLKTEHKIREVNLWKDSLGINWILIYDYCIQLHQFFLFQLRSMQKL